MTQDDAGRASLLTLLGIEREVRRAETEAQARYVMVNRTRALLDHRQAVLLRRTIGGGLAVAAVTDVAVPDRDAPMLRWAERAARSLDQPGDAPRRVTAAALPPDTATDWSAFAPSETVWLPLRCRGRDMGVLWLWRDIAVTEAEIVLAGQLADSYAHAWAALAPERRMPLWLRARRRALAIGLAALLIVVLMIPVRQSALAPAEVVPARPLVVAAPLDGVIETVHVRPNAPVALGDVLFSFEDSVLRNRLAIAREELAVAQAELRTASQSAFSAAEGRAKLALLRSRVELRRAEVAWAEDRLSRVDVTAEADGVAVFRDAGDWTGRPVKTGEKVMVLADPHATELRLHLAVADALVLDDGAPVTVFLDTAPLAPVAARLRSAAYEPSLSENDVLGYRVIAAFAPDTPGPRLGLTGTAKVEGPRAPLALHLFRRPLSAARQWLGW